MSMRWSGEVWTANHVYGRRDSGTWGDVLQVEGKLLQEYDNQHKISQHLFFSCQRNGYDHHYEVGKSWFFQVLQGEKQVLPRR